MRSTTNIGLNLVVPDSSLGDVDLEASPTRCSTCPDNLTHVRRAAASLCTDVDDTRLVLQMLGLAPSPPPPSTAARRRRGHR